MDKENKGCVMVEYAMLPPYRTRHEMGKTNYHQEIRLLTRFLNIEIYQRDDKGIIQTYHTMGKRLQDIMSQTDADSWLRRSRTNELIQRLQQMGRVSDQF